MALFYGAGAPLADLKAFDIAVVEPDHGYDPAAYRTADSELYAYVAVGEVQPGRAWFKDLPAAWKMARNGDWNSIVLDQTPAEWPDFLADRVVGPLWRKGYRGFFLDTLDSYRLASRFDEAAQQQGLIRVVETLHRRYPGIRLILNRGFEIVPFVRDKVQMVAAESIFRGWNAGGRHYQAVPADDREWLLGQLRTVRDRFGLPVLAIDYVPPHDRRQTRETAERIQALGFIPWVTDSKLETLGIGTIEVLPRRVLVLYGSSESPALNYANAHRFLQMPLNHMGYVVDYADINQELPRGPLADRYAGVATWFSGEVGEAAGKGLSRWLLARVREGLPLAVLGNFGMGLEGAAARELGLAAGIPTPAGRLRIARQHPMLGFEIAPQATRTQLLPVRLADRDAQPLIELRDGKDQSFVGGALTRWGGFILDPFATREFAASEQARWVIDPFAFLAAALRLAPLPAPDVTTENGRRLVFSHIDGDGFPSVAELPGRPLAAAVLLKDILERYRLPTTASVIEAEVSPRGLYPPLGAKLEAIARRMFALPHVEIASHSYTHPFRWDNQVRHGVFAGAQEESYHLELPGYEFNLDREIVGSVDYIRRHLAPPGKPVDILLWSGDTAPGADALEIADRAGLLNMNGGDTAITRANPTLTAVGALGIEKNGRLQVYAPVTNENIYTNLWRGPFYGYERVIETFEMTESPRRLKPVDIYYHVYSASKRAGLAALHKVFAWAQGQPLHPVFASAYIRKVRDFHRLVLARDGKGWRVRGAGDLRTLRLPPALGRPDLETAIGVAGFSPGSEGQYVHLTGASAWFAPLAEGRENRRPYLHDANGRLADWHGAADGRRTTITLAAHQPLAFSLAGAGGCRVRADGRSLAPTQRAATGDVQPFRLDHAAAKIEIDCPAP